jgi:hypothetical protein
VRELVLVQVHTGAGAWLGAGARAGASAYRCRSVAWCGSACWCKCTQGKRHRLVQERVLVQVHTGEKAQVGVGGRAGASAYRGKGAGWCRSCPRVDASVAIHFLLIVPGKVWKQPVNRMTQVGFSVRLADHLAQVEQNQDGLPSVHYWCSGYRLALTASDPGFGTWLCQKLFATFCTD